MACWTSPWRGRIQTGYNLSLGTLAIGGLQLLAASPGYESENTAQDPAIITMAIPLFIGSYPRTPLPGFGLAVPTSLPETVNGPLMPVMNVRYLGIPR
jgi:hypothetical protein